LRRPWRGGRIGRRSKEISYAGDLLAVALALASSAAQGDVFTCTVDGRTVTSDQPPSECAGVSIRELNSDGSTKRTIKPPIDQATLRARQEEQQRAQREQQQLRRTNRSLLIPLSPDLCRGDPQCGRSL
jgi:uncharacterized protein DUF4124